MSSAWCEGLEDRRLMSAAQLGQGDMIHLRGQQKLQDGSCQTTVVVAATTTPCGGKLQTRARLQDGSCKA